MRFRRALGLLLMAVAIGAPLGAWASHAPTQGVPDYSGLQAAIEGRLVLSSTEAAAAAPLDAALVLVRPAPPSPAVADLVERRLASNSTVWIFDDQGAWNHWMAARGAAVDPTPLVSAAGTFRLHGEGQDGPLARGQVGTVLLTSDAWVPLWSTGPEAHVDANRNGTVDRLDLPGPHVVAATWSSGHGRLVLVAAAQVLEGPAIDPRLGTTLMAEAPTMVIDVSSAGMREPERAFAGLAKTTAPLAAWPSRATGPFLGALGVLALLFGGLLRQSRPFQSHQSSDPEQPPMMTDPEE